MKDDQDLMELLLEAFSGNILTEIFHHFETKCYDSPRESAKWSECFRALQAILYCAGKINGESTDGLREHIVSELQKSWDLPPEQRCRTNFSPYVSLLCAWDMSEEVAKCLSSSISNYFEEGDEQPRKKKAKGKKESLPVLYIDVAISILGHILQGTHPSSVAARDSLLNSDSCYNHIVAALGKALDVASRIIRPIGVSVFSSIPSYHIT